jgi:hypothetical protein
MLCDWVGVVDAASAIVTQWRAAEVSPSVASFVVDSVEVFSGELWLR